MRYDSGGRKLAAHDVKDLCESLKRFGDLNGQPHTVIAAGDWQLRNAVNYASGCLTGS